MKNKKVLIITSIAIIILLCIAFTTKAFQNDTFYTIKVGESITQQGIDMKDHFSWHKLDYTYPHWLYDVVTYKLYDLGGFNILYLVTIVTFIVIGISFYFINLKRNKSYFLSLLFSILMIIMLARFMTARAQSITYLLFLIEVYFIEQLLEAGKKRYGVFLLLICLLIANIHVAVWPFYFVLFSPYIVEYLVVVVKSKIKSRLELGIFADKIELNQNKYIKYLGIVFVVSLLVGFLTPLGLVPFTYFIKTLQGNSMEYINEHKALVLVQNLFVVGYLLLLLVTLIFTKVRIKLADLLMVAGLLLMAFLSQRHVALLSVVGMFYLCRLVCNIGKIGGSEVLDFDLPWYGIFVVVVTIIITSGLVYHVNSKEQFIDESKYPVGMVDYMNKNLDMDAIKLYNDYDFGSYLLFRDIPVYIDSRSDLYTKPFNGKADIFDECMNITKNYGRVFKRYGITHILIYKDTDLNQILAASPNYDLIHREGRFMLYEYKGLEENED